MENITILLVDNDQQSNDALAKGLMAEKYAVQQAYTAEECLQILQDPETTDLVVVCLDLAAAKDYALLQEIKNLYPEKQLILTSSHEDHDHMGDTNFTGAYTILPKPVDVELLINSLGLSLSDKLEGAMVAASLAQAGAFEEADQTLTEMENMEEVSSKAETSA